MKLLLDIGNTRIKWRMAGREGRVAHTQDDWGAQLNRAWHELAAPTAVCAGSVAGERINQAVVDGVRHVWPKQDVIWLRSQASCCGIRIQYANPERFGVDRFAALVAARAEFTDRSLIVVDAGTAITVDALDDAGLHHGGLIMPGLRLLNASLTSGAAQLQENAVPAGISACLPQHETQLAMSAGGLCMLQGGVIHALEQAMRVLGGTPEVVLTGGDHAWLDLSEFESVQLKVYRREALVLDGLERMSQDEMLHGCCPRQ